ncbi:rhodanese-like domain-containing protein [Nonomuraea spiralis]|uniref:Rhodanese-like domain-containing protein n=1 Tax=Nonomuraea spiralis TaxID=46182 RepID=A0ABV5IZU5_9ACTN|nr:MULTISPECIES: rhodanese-like domain-containing protein [Nonomuraea]RSN16143.1 sulfurtransferase [Nonomuraea sp. WAC 01424]GGS88926.1 sulfurtransferase [Nonomuraea spiralis]
MTITREELHANLGGLTVLDTLGGSYYAQQHLPGAVALVESEVAERAAELLPDKDAPIVTYCSNPACGNSKAVANRLTALGYTDVRRYVEGIEDWVGAGLPVESSL